MSTKVESITYAIHERALIDLTLSENPLGASLGVRKAIESESYNVHLYPSNEDDLLQALAKHHNILEKNILLGSGANGLLEDFIKVFALGKNVVVPEVTFPEIVLSILRFGGSCHRVPLLLNLSLDLNGLLNAVQSNSACIHICNPNNPTGIWTEAEYIRKLADISPVPILISEAGADFAKDSILNEPLHPNIIVVRSFSKSYGLAGLRIGYMVGAENIIKKMKLSLRSYRASSLAIAGAIAALEDQEHLKKSVDYLLREKKWLVNEVLRLNFEVIPSNGATFLMKVPEFFGDANTFCKLLKTQDVAVVNCSIYQGLGQYIRISPQKREINKKYLLILKKIIKEKKYG